jgi:hypothetical protein
MITAAVSAFPGRRRLETGSPGKRSATGEKINRVGLQSIPVNSERLPGLAHRHHFYPVDIHMIRQVAM